MPYQLILPVHNVVPPLLPDTRGVQRRLWRYYGANPRGRSLIGPYPTYTTVDNPAADQLVGTEGVDWFLGGHSYVVSDVVGTALQASGYGANLTEITWAALAAFSWGDLGTWEAPI